MSRAELDGFDAADVQRALGAIGDGPVVDSVEELLERRRLGGEQDRRHRGRLLFAAAAVLFVGFGVAVLARLRTGTKTVTADLAGCSQARWYVEEPRGLTMVPP